MTSTTLRIASMIEPDMTEQWAEKRDDPPGRRSTDGELVRAADSAIAIRWRWAQMLVTVLGIGFMAGVYWLQSTQTQKAVAELRGDFKEFRAELTQVRESRQADAILIGQASRDYAAMKETVAELREQIRELRGQVDNMRSMREAYVWSSSGGAKKRDPPP